MTETLRYRFSNPEEIPEIARLVSHSFPGPARTALSWEEQLRDPAIGGGADSLLIGYDGKRIAAALQVYPLKQWIGGRLIPLAGVGMVTVSPTHRKRRVAGELMTQALRAARERGDLASALYPFRVSFYQKLGYGQAGEAHQLLVRTDWLPDSDERMRVGLLDDVDRRAGALDLYNRWAQRQTGQLERNARVWAQLCNAHDRVLVGYHAAKEELQGYALAHYRADLPRTERYFEVEELVWTTAEARRGLYGWLASLGDQWERVLLRELPGSRLADWVREPRLPPNAAPGWRLWAPAATLMHGPMFRLLDVKAAWEQRTVNNTAPFAVAFIVIDEQIPENNGTWRLTIDGTRVTVDRQPQGDLTIGLNVSTLSRLYIGALSPQQAVNAGLMECDRPDLLATLGNALALPEPWMFDQF